MALRDVILIGVIIFILGTSFFIVNFSMNQIINGVKGTTAINSTAPAMTALNATQQMMNSRLDYIVFGVMIALVLALMISSWFIAANAIFIFIYLIIITFGVFTAAFLSNIWEAFTSSSVFGATITYFPITNHIITNMPYYCVTIGVLGMVIMFAKPTQS